LLSRENACVDAVRKITKVLKLLVEAGRELAEAVRVLVEAVESLQRQ
jgi:hypothetical protein